MYLIYGKQRNFPLLFALIYNDKYCLYSKIFLILRCRIYATNIFDESVLAFIFVLKPGKFRMLQGRQHTRHLVFVSYMDMLHIPYGCGVLFICSIGVPEPQNR